MRTQGLVSCIAMFALVAIAANPNLTRAGTGPSRSLEQQLLEDLDTNPLDPDLQRDEHKPKDKAPAAKPAPEEQKGEPKAGEDLERQLSRELGAAAVSEADDPLLAIVQQMHHAQSLIGKAQAGEKTQQLQAGILASLDQLLKAARDQKQPSQGSQSNSKQDAPRRTPNQTEAKASGTGKPNAKSAKTSQAKPGKSGSRRPDMTEMSEVLKNVWGELPEHEREQMLELPMEEFLPKYELLIESYFKRLAEEQGRE